MISYQTIKSKVFAEYKEKGSKFLTFLFPVFSIIEVEKYLDEIIKLHPKATHHCFAYRLEPDGHIYRANDDGEPSGTAGLPILGQIDSATCTCVLAVVVRYFGGVQLGTSGLIKAYKYATRLAFEQAEKIIKPIEKEIVCNIDTYRAFILFDFCKKYNIEISKKFINQKTTIVFRIDEINKQKILSELEELSIEIESIS